MTQSNDQLYIIDCDSGEILSYNCEWNFIPDDDCLILRACAYVMAAKKGWKILGEDEGDLIVRSDPSMMGQPVNWKWMKPSACNGAGHVV